MEGGALSASGFTYKSVFGKVKLTSRPLMFGWYAREVTFSTNKNFPPRYGCAPGRSASGYLLINKQNDRGGGGGRKKEGFNDALKREARGGNMRCTSAKVCHVRMQFRARVQKQNVGTRRKQRHLRSKRTKKNRCPASRLVSWPPSPLPSSLPGCIYAPDLQYAPCWNGKLCSVPHRSERPRPHL